MQAVMGSFLVVVFGLFGGGFFGLPLSTPPLPADPVVDRAAPSDCLAHFELRGLAQPAASSTNQTELLLAEPEVREFTAAFAAEVAKALRTAAVGDAEAQALVGRLTPFATVIATRPAALTVTRFAFAPDGPPEIEASLVVNVGRPDRPAFLSAAEALVGELLREAPPGVKVSKANVAGGEWNRVAAVRGLPEMSWGFRGDHFLFTLGAGALESLLARLDDAAGGPPAWKVEALKRMPVDRLATLVHVDVDAVVQRLEQAAGDPGLRAILNATGLASVRCLSAVTGMTAEGLKASTWLAFSGKPQGIFAAGAAIGADDLAAVPADAVMAHVFKLDLSATLASLLRGIEIVDPGAVAGMQTDLERFRETFRLDLDADLFASLGDTWRVFLLPGGGSLVPNAAVVISARDRARLEQSHAVLLKQFRAVAADPEAGIAVAVKETPYRGTTVFTLESKVPLPVTPAWCLTDDALIVTVSPQLMRTLLGRPRDDKGLAVVPAVRDAVAAGGGALLGYLEPAALVNSLCGSYEMLAPMARAGLAEQGLDIEPPPLPALRSILPHARPSVSLLRRVGAEGLLLESQGTLPLGPLSSGNGIVGGSPATTGVLAGLLLPAVQSAREAARRTATMNNMRQLLLAMLIHADARRSLPAPAICDHEGKPLLSWRVMVLPYLEAGDLYKEFHLDEPWDSEHNKKLLERMPDVYRDPNAPADTTTTVYVMPTGPGTLFPTPSVGPTPDSVTDGTSRTVALVEVSREHAVPWTKPDDIDIDAQDPAAALRGDRPGGFLAGFADGHIQMLDATLIPETLRAIFTPNGGESVMPE